MRKAVSLDLSGLADGVQYGISEINCTEPHGAKLDGRNMKLTLRGPYDSAVFEVTRTGSVSGAVGVF